MQITISRANLCLFQHASRQSHHYNHLKMGKIPITPQTRNQCGARTSVGQPFDSMTSNRMTSDLLILQFSSDTFNCRNAKPGKFWAAEVLDLAPGSIRTPMPGPTPSEISHRLLLLAKLLAPLAQHCGHEGRNPKKMFALFIHASTPT